MLSIWFSDRARSQDGFTLIELMVAASLIGIALVGVMGGLDAGARLTLEAQRHEQAVSVAQKEIERVRELPYAQLALSHAPSHEDAGTEAGDPYESYPLNPNYWVQGDPGTHFAIVADYGDEASGPPSETSVASEPLVVHEEGLVAPGPEPAATLEESDGSEWHFEVWRYVTCREDDGEAGCDPWSDSTRITVAVLPAALENGTGPIRPFYLSTVLPPPVDEGQVGS